MREDPGRKGSDCDESARRALPTGEKAVDRKPDSMALCGLGEAFVLRAVSSETRVSLTVTLVGTGVSLTVVCGGTNRSCDEGSLGDEEERPKRSDQDLLAP